MANLVSDIMGMATPAMIDKAASSFGISGAAASSVLSAAVPSVMGALINKGSTPSGAKDILASLSNASPNFSSALTGANASTMAMQGTSMLSSLIGGGGVSTLANAVANNAGVPATAGASLMGLASQLVMSGLSKQATGLDPAGLSNLLASQKDSVQAMLPPGLGSILGMSGMASSAMKATSSTASSAASTASSTMRNTASQAPASMPDTSTDAMSWLKYAVPVAIVVLAAWYFLGHRGTDEATMTKPAATATAPAAPAAAPAPAATATAPAAPAATATAPATPAAGNMMVGDIDVSKNLTSSLSDMTAALGGITDVASAQAALPKLQAAGTNITTVTGLADKFSPEQKTAVAGLVNNSLPAITAAATKAEAISGVGDIVKPVLDGIINSLSTMK